MPRRPRRVEDDLIPTQRRRDQYRAAAAWYDARIAAGASERSIRNNPVQELTPEERQRARDRVARTAAYESRLRAPELPGPPAPAADNDRPPPYVRDSARDPYSAGVSAAGRGGSLRGNTTTPLRLAGSNTAAAASPQRYPAVGLGEARLNGAVNPLSPTGLVAARSSAGGGDAPPLDSRDPRPGHELPPPYRSRSNSPAPSQRSSAHHGP